MDAFDREWFATDDLWSAIGEDLKKYTVERDVFAPTGWVYERKSPYRDPGDDA
ncbi:hypothetical protein [Nonomuraea endophytica]|uniref:hypothetical protein n=1 Tax=Nonomuraea endophytica TaxID=714136 RepID=UPI0037C5DB11